MVPKLLEEKAPFLILYWVVRCRILSYESQVDCGCYFKFEGQSCIQARSIQKQQRHSWVCFFERSS